MKLSEYLQMNSQLLNKEVKVTSMRGYRKLVLVISKIGQGLNTMDFLLDYVSHSIRILK